MKFENTTQKALIVRPLFQGVISCYFCFCSSFSKVLSGSQDQHSLDLFFIFLNDHSNPNLTFSFNFTLKPLHTFFYKYEKKNLLF